MSFLHYKCNGRWDYPKGGDVIIVDARYVFLGPVVPMQTDSLRNGFLFKEDEDSLKKYKTIKKNNTDTCR